MSEMYHSYDIPRAINVEGSLPTCTNKLCEWLVLTIKGNKLLACVRVVPKEEWVCTPQASQRTLCTQAINKLYKLVFERLTSHKQ